MEEETWELIFFSSSFVDRFQSREAESKKTDTKPNQEKLKNRFSPTFFIFVCRKLLCHHRSFPEIIDSLVVLVVVVIIIIVVVSSKVSHKGIASSVHFCFALYFFLLTKKFY